VRPGQVVAKAVTNANGAVLCPTGFELTEAAIARLKQSGIESVILEGEGEAGEDNYEERIEALEDRFREVEDPLLLQLKAAIEKRLRFFTVEKGGA
jgi:hypothetical protein